MAAILVAVSLAACTTPVQFTSNPPGAEVTYRGKAIGVTPFQYDVQDQFGWFSVYEFKATRAGYKPKVLSFPEPTIFHAQLVVPQVVNFNLEPEAPPAYGSWVLIDITSIYKSWQDGTRANYGLAFVPDSTNNDFTFFASTENSNKSWRPKLVITKSGLCL